MLAIGIGGAALARLQARGMVRTLLAMAGAHAGILLIAMAAGLGTVPAVAWVFPALWLASAGLFRVAAGSRVG